MVELISSWLLAPIDASRPHDIGGVLAWHGRLMTLAWGICIPVGIFIARYFKVTPRQNWPKVLDNTFWWHSHLSFQYAGGITMLIGFGLVALDGFSQISNVHQLLGWIVLLLGLCQIISGSLRGTKGGPTDPGPDGQLSGDHYDMTKRRIVFEAFHKTLGHGLLLAGAVTVLAGLWTANAPHWMWISILLFWCCLAIGSVICERRGYRRTSYAAIWGYEYEPDDPGSIYNRYGKSTASKHEDLGSN